MVLPRIHLTKREATFSFSSVKNLVPHDPRNRLAWYKCIKHKGHVKDNTVDKASLG